MLLTKKKKQATEIERKLILDNLFNGTHWALFNAIATSNARFFVYYRANAIYYLNGSLRTSVNANTTTDAFVSQNHWMGHEYLFSHLFGLRDARGIPSIQSYDGKIP